MIEVTADRSRKLVIAHMGGFLSPEEVDGFARDRDAAIKAMGLRSGEYFMLVDTSTAVIQPQEIVAAFQHLIANSSYKARRIAIVRKSSLTRMQTVRILSIREDAAVFETLEEAETWLFAS